MLEDNHRIYADGEKRDPEAGQLLTIFDEGRPPYTLKLSAFRNDSVVFGRGKGNDIVLNSMLVSGHPAHGRLVRENGQWRIEDLGSTHGLICNNSYIQSRVIHDGDLIRIGSLKEASDNGVLFLFSSSDSFNRWQYASVSEQIVIGRAPDCDVVLPHVTVSNHHARIFQKAGRWYIEDTNSTNGVIVNDHQIQGAVSLHEKDVIVITNSRLIFTRSGIYYCCLQSGISLDVEDVVIVRGKGKRTAITGNHISLSIKPGELIAIIGGSGAGKSTILNCMCGYLKPAEGAVYVNGMNLYQNFDALKKTFGYVPQADIVYDNLTLWDMLSYSAELRLPMDTGEEERRAAIERAIRTVNLEDQRDRLIGRMSGGQRKRASIAVELLSDPRLMFLDEPASGLDPGTERNLMQSLRNMADRGKTIILVTHSTLQLKLCDKIVFMGKGGNLCFFGSYNEALRFFGVNDIVDVYDPITNHAQELAERYNRIAPPVAAPISSDMPSQKRTLPRQQLRVLCSRYLRLVTNDRQRLLLLLIQAPLLALLISFVADGEQYNQYEMTKSLLFALSCSAFWIGMLNSIQEVCKERTILKREYMTGLSLGTYMLSKISVLGLMCLVQSVMVTGIFAVTVGLPDQGVVLSPFTEFLLTAFLTALASSAMGLFVSSLFTNADRAMTVAPILLMPQILFSGLLFKLEGLTKTISWFAICRWSMEGFGTTANINELPMRLQQKGIPVEHEAEAFFEFTVAHYWKTCWIMLGFTVLFLLLARFALAKLRNEST